MVPIDFRTSERTGNGSLEIMAMRTSHDLLRDCCVGDWISFELEVLVHEEVEKTEIGIGFRDRSGQLITGFHSHFSPVTIEKMEVGKRYTLSVDVQMQIKPRPYLLMIGLGVIEGAEHWVDHDTLWDCSQVVVHGEREFWGLAPMPYRDFKLVAGKIAAAASEQ